MGKEILFLPQKIRTVRGPIRCGFRKLMELIRPFFFDDNGKSYIIYNSIPPEDKPLYQGHRTIRMFEFDKDKLSVKGEEKIIINGGTDINKKPVWIEAPHIF